MHYTDISRLFKGAKCLTSLTGVPLKNKMYWSVCNSTDLCVIVLYEWLYVAVLHAKRHKMEVERVHFMQFYFTSYCITAKFDDVKNSGDLSCLFWWSYSSNECCSGEREMVKV